MLSHQPFPPLRLLFFNYSSTLKLSLPSFSLSSSFAPFSSQQHRSLAYRCLTTSLIRNHQGSSMEETQSSSSSFEFNKRRAEGMDKSDNLRGNNLHLKVRRLNPTNTTAYVQILGTGMDTQDTSPSVLLFFDKQRFIFNAGEGLQRFCTEHKIKLSKIDHIFLSRVCSETAGGLPGLLLTLAGIGEEGLSVNVWGPSDFKYLVDAMRCFIQRAAIVNTHSFGPASSSDSPFLFDQSKQEQPIVLVNDEVVKISAVILRPSCSEDSARKSSETSVIYVCELPEIIGKFDPKKAASLGLKPGKKYGELQSGKSVKSDSLDIMVHPSDVMGPSVPGPIVLLVDCPTQSHAEALFSIESLSNYHTNPSCDSIQNSKTVSCIIHLSPLSVISSPTYQSWMNKFASAKHINAGHEMKNMKIPILGASARIAARLNYLCPQFFPAPGYWSPEHFNKSESDLIASSKGLDSNLCESISAENLLKFNLRPYANLGLDRSCIPSPVTSSLVIDELLSEIPDIERAAQDVKQLWLVPEVNNMIEESWSQETSLPMCLENIRRDDLEIVLLGTGSSQPSKYRNVSSIYVDLFSKGSLLLDCGEGTLGQLKRRYGLAGADHAVKNLKFIWISHIHADHHAGLARILALRRDLLKRVPHEPLLVIGPRQLKRFLDAYQKLEDLDAQFLDCWSTTAASWDSSECNHESDKDSEGTLFARGSPMQSVLKRPIEDTTAFPLLKKLKRVLNEAGLEDLISFPVVHCPQAFGVALKAAERINNAGKLIPGWKIVYSGDTRPCPTLIEAARGATILINEATFEDGMVEEAVAKNHSTTKEAIEVGSSAGVYRIILTHFSQRYPKIPVLDETHMHKTCIAFDLMSINIADLQVLPKIVPYLKLMFKDEIEVEELENVIGDASVAS